MASFDNLYEIDLLQNKQQHLEQELGKHKVAISHLKAKLVADLHEPDLVKNPYYKISRRPPIQAPKHQFKKPAVLVKSDIYPKPSKTKLPRRNLRTREIDWR